MGVVLGVVSGGWESSGTWEASGKRKPNVLGLVVLFSLDFSLCFLLLFLIFILFHHNTTISIWDAITTRQEPPTVCLRDPPCSAGS